MAASRLLQGCSAVNRRLTSGAPHPPPPREVLPLPQVSGGFPQVFGGVACPQPGFGSVFPVRIWFFTSKCGSWGGPGPLRAVWGGTGRAATRAAPSREAAWSSAQPGLRWGGARWVSSHPTASPGPAAPECFITSIRLI